MGSHGQNWDNLSIQESNDDNELQKKKKKDKE